MTHLPQSPEPAEVVRLRNLFAAVLDGTANQAELQECETKLQNNEFARDYYLRFVQLQVLLEEKFATLDLSESELSRDVDAFSVVVSGDMEPLATPPSILLDAAIPAATARGWFAPGATAFSYAMSAMVMLIGLLFAWSWVVPRHVEVANTTPASRTEDVGTPVSPYVGRITGAVNCRLGDGSEAADGKFLKIGERLAIAEGLLEITYTTGAQVLIEGPSNYVVESSTGGYLSLGRLAARVDGSDRKHESAAGDVAAQVRMADHPAVKFFVRTPTSIVQDLGTEFAVEVDKSGASQAHVFQGKVVLQPLAEENREPAQAIPLTANQSASVTLASNNKTIVRRTDDTLGQPFVRRLPQRVRVKAYNSGIGLKEGDSDPHWQVVARTDQPSFRPMQAIVTPILVAMHRQTGQTATFQLPNEPARSCWISLNGNRSSLPGGVTYTFRTTFDLADFVPSTAALWGRVIADDEVTAIRINGKPIEVRPAQFSPLPLYEWQPFSVNSGFVAGKNTLEIDVLNRASGIPNADFMSCRVELEVSAVQDWHKFQEGDSKAK